MKFILKAYNVWELGKRVNQEDALFPEYGKIQDTDRLFILCDGMGGHEAGEVASRTVCEAMSESVLKNCPDGEEDFTDEQFRQALSDTFDALDKKDNGTEKKMGTTMTFLKLHNKGCTIAHIGDSRVYHLRPGKNSGNTEIIFQTEDHSLVNDLVKIGEITREEAKLSPQRNIITRAMQPCMERRPKADIYHTHDIKPGDYFFMCSDGILEHMEDDDLKNIISEEGGDDNDKINMILKATSQNKDNHSAILVHIMDVIDPFPIEKADTAVPHSSYSEYADHDCEITVPSNVSESSRKLPFNLHKNKNKKWLGIVVAILIVTGICLGIYYSRKTKENKVETNTEQKNIIVGTEHKNILIQYIKILNH